MVWTVYWMNQTATNATNCVLDDKECNSLNFSDVIQVVQLCRSSCHVIQGEMVLIVRSNGKLVLELRF